MLATAQTCAVGGLDGYIVKVEVDISPGLPAFNLVGLPDTAVQEAREGGRAALRNSGCDSPLHKNEGKPGPRRSQEGRPFL